MTSTSPSNNTSHCWVSAGYGKVAMGGEVAALGVELLRANVWEFGSSSQGTEARKNESIRGMVTKPHVEQTLTAPSYIFRWRCTRHVAWSWGCGEFMVNIHGLLWAGGQAQVYNRHLCKC